MTTHKIDRTQADEMKPKPASGSSPIAAAFYYLLMILLFPAFLLGYVIWISKFLFGRKQKGASATAQSPLFARWLQHNLGTRLDEPTNRLWRVASNVPPLGWRLVAGPLLFASRVSGYVPK